MTTDRPAEGQTAMPRVARHIIGLVVSLLLALVSLVALSLTGWGFETEPAAQLQRDLPQLMACAATGAGSGAALAWAFVGARMYVVALLTAVGTLPALVMVSAYFSHRY